MFASSSWIATAQARLAMTAQMRDIRMTCIKRDNSLSATVVVARLQKVMNG